MITISRGDIWQRILRLEAGPLYSLPIQSLHQDSVGRAVLVVPGHGLPARWRVAIQGLDWPGVASRHQAPGTDDWQGVSAVDADHLQLDSAMPLPDYCPGACIQFRQPLPLDGVQLSVLFLRRGGLPLLTDVDMVPNPTGVRLTVAPHQTRHWPLGALQCRIKLRWPDGQQRSHTLTTLYVEN